MKPLLNIEISFDFYGTSYYTGFINGRCMFCNESFHDNNAAKRELVEYAVLIGFDVTVDDVKMEMDTRTMS